MGKCISQSFARNHKPMLGNYFTYIWSNAEKEYKEKILSLVEVNKKGKILDMGCDDGEWTIKLAQKMQAKQGNIYGIDVIKKRYVLAEKKGVFVKESDLNKKLPFQDNEMDFMHANQVIEHLWNLDIFVTEIKRVLKKGGYAIICTENLASWHNIFALFFGFQPFSITNISFQGAIGNPLALHVGDSKKAGMRSHGSWHHTRVLAFEGLKDIFVQHGMRVDYFGGFGYFPFPPIIANVFSRYNPKHAAFPVLKVRKV